MTLQRKKNKSRRYIIRGGYSYTLGSRKRRLSREKTNKYLSLRKSRKSRKSRKYRKYRKSRKSRTSLISQRSHDSRGHRSKSRSKSRSKVHGRSRTLLNKSRKSRKSIH